MSAPEADAATQTAQGPTQRLFFALWPNGAVRAALYALTRQHAHRNGRAVAAENLHITLAFVGGVTAGRRVCMEAAVAMLRATPFTVTLDRLGFWSRPKILWAGASAAPAELTGLVAALTAALIPCGYQPEPRPFQVHVSLARQAQRPPEVQEIPPIVWPADAVCLVESVSGEHGSEYRVIGRWPLRG